MFKILEFPQRSAVPHLSPLWLASSLGAAASILGLTAAALRRRRAADHASADSHRVQDVMIGNVQVVEPGTTVLEAAQRMRLDNVGMLPIVENGTIKGVITDRDLVVRALARSGVDPSMTTVMDCATRDPVVGHPGWTLEKALVVMAEQQVGRLPVVDDSGRLVGLVTLSSIVLRSQKTDETMAAARKISLRSAKVA